MTESEILKFAKTELHLDVIPQAISGSKIYACETSIRPKVADDWLEKYNAKNRNPRQGVINRYANDQANGMWIVSHQGIAFDESKQLISGQHRLAAVVRSGVEIRSLVFLNCLAAERNVVDQTASRNVRDVAALGHGELIGSDVVSTARAMAYGSAVRRPVQMTPQETLTFIQTHRASLDFVLGKISQKVRGITSATVIGAICVGYYHLKRAEITHFIEVLVEGFTMNDRDRPIILLRNWLLENCSALRNSDGRAKAYLRTEAALLAYKNGDSPSRLEVPRAQIFKLPEAS